MTSRILAALIVAAATATWTPVADAASWVTSGPLSPPGKVAVTPQLVVTPGGERIAAWVQEGQDGLTGENVSVRSAPPGGDFGATQTFAGNPFGLQTATAADGSVAIGWVEFASRTVHIARRAPGQATFTEATPLVIAGQENPFGLDIAFRGGDVFAAVVSSRQTGGRGRSVWAFELAAGANAVALAPGFGAGGAIDHAENDDLANKPEVFYEAASIATQGDAVTVVWEKASTKGVGPNSTAVERSTQPAGGNRFPLPFDVDTQAGAGSFAPVMPASVAAGGGHTYVVWARDRADAVLFQDLSIAPGITRTIPGIGGFGVDGLHVAADGSGGLVAAWATETDASDNPSVYAALVPAGATAGTSAPVSPVGIDRDVGDLAVAADGASLVLPVRAASSRSNTLEVEGALRAPGAASGPVESVSGIQDSSPVNFFGAAPSAAVLPGGRALALWTASDHDGAISQRLFLSERDTTAPAFTAITSPESAVAGRRAAFAATATDDLSDAAISWDFGDGTTATGASVTHVFGAAGASTVTVTARDSAGNTTTQTRVVAVSAAPADPPPPGDGGGGGRGVPPRDTTAPVVGKLTASNRRFSVASGATAVLAAKKKTKKAPRGTVVRLTLSERATLVVTLGLKQGKRLQSAGTLVRSGAGPGAVSVAFSGRIGKSALKPGAYVATVTAIDGSGNRSKPKTLNLTIVKR